MGLFTKKEKVKALPEAFAGQRTYTGSLAEAAKPGAIERLRLAGTAYPGELVAPLSEFEEEGLGELGEFLKSEMPTESKLYGLSQEELEKTIGGEYDPYTSEYWKAYQTEMARQLREAKDRIAARTSARDKFYGGGRIAEEANVEEAAMNQLALTLAELAENERARRLEAVPAAEEFMQFGESIPLQRIVASQEYGALPRELEQALLDAQYQEWLRQLTDLGIPLDTALALATYSPGAVKTGGGLTDLGVLLAAISSGVGSYYASKK